ncbi:hypothetical protein RUM44_005817 [Polyplax serrata]|uniref:Unconventional myosin-IXb-like n=1 Tax=Polyplax serrata TaxID=468196 RepID=A0ABR1AY50_POLSC
MNIGENRYIVQVYVGALSLHYEALSVEASKQTTCEEIVLCIFERLSLKDSPACYELAEVIGDCYGQECKERRLGSAESPVQLMLLWPKLHDSQQEYYRFYLREKLNETPWTDSFSMDPSLIRDYLFRFLYQQKDREYPDLCQLPDLNEQTLLDNLQARFEAGHIYTYVGSILIALNPFKFYPIYNPKYVKLYQNCRLGSDLPPHIFAVADAAYHCMLKEKRNQCVVISGESGSGKTESTNFLLHHLTALSQKGSHGSGVEQTILSAGPVLESGCFILDNADEKYEFSRLKQSMEMVGFNAEKQRRLFSVLSSVLLLGNVEFQPRKATYHHDEAVAVCNPEIVALISELLKVKEETLMTALTAKRAKASGETLIINYRLPEAVAARDAMAKCLYGALFDWIVLQLNHALLSKKDTLRQHQGNSIGVLDIFGFEDFGQCNSFEQLCINYANEHLQFYFNQHVFKYEQEEYRKENIRWSNIEFMDNTGCLHLIEGKPFGLLCVLDDQCNFPGATNETLVQKFNSVHKDNEFYEIPQRRESAFIVRHYAGKVKYQVAEMREKNLDLMRHDIVGVLKNSSMAFVRELVGADPVAVFRWAIVRAFFRSYFAFLAAGRTHRQNREGNKTNFIQQRYRNHIPNENVLRRWKEDGAVPYPRGKTEVPNDQRTRQRIYGSRCNEKVEEKRTGSSQVMEKANQIVMKNKSFRPRERGKRGLKNLQSLKTLAGRTQSTGTLGKRKQPLTVTAQFQMNLHSLMDTLNMANPFFIRCIKSNGQKIPNKFDEETVQRQLRYTGMLETVRIRQAGYNVRLTYEEFAQLYRILLPNGSASSIASVKHFLTTLNFNRDNYQLGSSKIFLKESEKVKLDYRLHQQIMSAIVTIQRWFRACLDRKKFLKWREAVITIQSFWRSVLAQRLVNNLRMQIQAVIQIQACYRRYLARKWFCTLRESTIMIQAHIRGFLVRQQYTKMLAKRKMPNTVAKTKRNDSILHARTVNKKEINKTTCEANNKLGMSGRSMGKSEDRTRDKIVEGSPQHAERKGSFDALLLPKQGDSSAIPVKDTINKAKKQLQAILGASKKADKWEITSAHSDGEIEENNSKRNVTNTWIPDQDYLHVKYSINDQQNDASFLSDINSKVKNMEVVPFVLIGETVDEEMNWSVSSEKEKDIWQTRKSALRRGTATPLNPLAPTRIARKQKKTLKNSSKETDFTTSDVICNKNKPNTLKEHQPLASLSGNIDRESSKEDHMGSAYLRTSSDPTSSKNTRSVNSTDVKTDSEYIKQSVNLGRRNSDNTEHSGELLEWKGRTMFTIGGHRFRKISRFSKQDRCIFCEKSMDAFVTQGHKCSECKQLFHTKCIQNGGVLQMPCQRKQSRKQPRAPYELKAPVASKFSLTGTSEFTDSTDKIISDVKELQKMQDFITKKIYKIESEEGKQRPSEVDLVFKQALREFKDNLVATYSVANRQGDALNIKYKDLIGNFIRVMKTVCNAENNREDFSVTMGVNAFRGFMNEFMTLSRVELEKPNNKKRLKEKRRWKMEDNINFNGHFFMLTVINIRTACEVCNSFFMWPIERSLVCQNCKMACHKKCYNKVMGECRLNQEITSGRRVFGVPVNKLANDGKVPLVVDRLITTIEMYGLYTEGIYRKSGVSSKVKELKAKIEEGHHELVNFENYQVHVLTSVLKCFFREMPEPLLTFDCYEDFLRAANLTEPHDRVSTLFAILKKLPKPNFDLMERLIFHLARVASQEETNRMNASALAIVFAPCILRTNKIVPAQDSLHDIGQQTQCIETIISEQLKKVRSTLADIDTLDTACHTATHRLSSLRSSKAYSPEDFLAVNNPCPTDQSEDEEALLVDHIQEIQKEKALLTSALPSLTRTTSDDDLLSTDIDDGSLDDADTEAGSRNGQDDPIMV